jgi:UDP-N-acetylmuramyl pentapeptide synthase
MWAKLRLSRGWVRPHVSIITNVDAVHIEHFHSERILHCG